MFYSCLNRTTTIVCYLYFRAFTSICYSADGQCILAGGQSKNVCIYNVQEGIILKKFEITQNRSFDAVDVICLLLKKFVVD